jgi:predicted enzyme related to lactoylglutathione lyase
MADARFGSFVWHELLTNDAKAAFEFYGHVAGWKTQPFEGDYTMWVGSQGPMGGVMKLPQGSPMPHWIGSVLVKDADATIALAQKLGGKLHVGPQDIPKVGRYAVLTDPQGAAFTIMAPTQPMTAHDHEKHGEFIWNELLTEDHQKAFAFYSELFGWKRISDFDMGPEMGTYLIYGFDGGKQSDRIGGMFTKPKGAPIPNTFFYYVHVDDLDAAVKRATDKGAKIQNGPMPVPDGARICQLTDPQGAWFALHESAKAAGAQ